MPTIPPSTQALRQITRTTLEARIQDLAAGRCRVRVPHPGGQMLKIKGMFFHAFPELFLQISGITRFSFPEDRFTLAPGDICVVPRGIPHGETVKSYRGPFRNLVVAFSERQILYHLAWERPSGCASIYAVNSIDPIEFGHFADGLNEAAFAFHGSSVYRKPWLHGMVLAFLAALYAVIETDRPPALSESFKVAQTRQWVMTHLADASLSVKQLAQRLRCSPNYLSWLFHQETGKPLSRFIAEQRLVHAKYLLEKSALNISEIAWASGYDDPGYFARCFRRVMGQSPRTYRRGLRQGGSSRE